MLVYGLRFYHPNSNLIKYIITTQEITLNTGTNKVVSYCPPEIRWEDVIAVLPFISGSLRDVSRSSVGAYGGDGTAYFYVDSYWDNQVVTTATIVWLFVINTFNF